MRRESGQAMVLSLLFLSVLLLLAAGMVDVYSLLEMRSSAYQAAQQAALAGVSDGRDWSSATIPPASGCTGPRAIELDEAAARAAAMSTLTAELSNRGVTNYTADVRVLPAWDGGSVSGYPPIPVRTGASRGYWSSSEPAVGVYLRISVDTFFLALVGRPAVDVVAFSSAGVAQPSGACPP